LRTKLRTSNKRPARRVPFPNEQRLTRAQKAFPMDVDDFHWRMSWNVQFAPLGQADQALGFQCIILNVETAISHKRVIENSVGIASLHNGKMI